MVIIILLYLGLTTGLIFLGYLHLINVLVFVVAVAQDRVRTDSRSQHKDYSRRLTIAMKMVQK